MEWPAWTAQAAVEAFEGVWAGSVAVASAAVDPTGRRCELSRDCPADARFEIGSLTKTMTGTLLASLAGDGVVALDAGIGHWLAAGPHGGVTLQELATHTSGLPRLAPGQPSGGDNPYAGLTGERAEADLRRSTCRSRGSFAYSNFGFQLLGLVLERAAGQSYQALLHERLLTPLSMTCSGVGAAGGGTRIPGHVGGVSVRPWDQPLPGAGGVEACADDLARYLHACLMPPPTALGAAVRLAGTPRVRIDDHQEIGLGWIIRDGRIRWHNGGTGGFAASAGIDGVARRAVTILVSTHGSVAPVLDRAVLLALAGDDPRAARPHPPGPEWDARARRLVEALVEGRFGDVHAGLAAGFGSRLSVEELQRVWQQSIADAGEPGQMSVTCSALGLGVAARVTLECSRRPLSIALAFDPDSMIDGLSLLRTGQAPPW